VAHARRRRWEALRRPEHHQYLSGRCRALDENIRSAYGRGIKADVVEGLRREYRRDCREEEQDAYSRISSERSSRESQRREQQQAIAQAAQADREQEARRAQQCAESRRVLASKRARTDLTEGEKNDLRRFEEAFLQRCTR
jgi:FKBP-type peptidyl-prolyl cis-trans isomerase